MLSSIRRTFRRLKGNTSGNATLLVALGLPALIGGSGFAVDTAQWYMWKRELQYAVDQAALAGAWARTQSGTKDAYAISAKREYDINLSTTEDIASTPTISLANWAGGKSNSVVVSAEASRSLPFSSMLTGEAATVQVYAQAAYTEGASFTSCLVATDEDADGAIRIGGGATLTAGCGMAALSNSPSSIIVDGNPQINSGWVLSRGGIDDWFDTNTADQIHEYLDGLQDPFATLSPPNPVESQVARTYACVKGKTTKWSNVTVTSTSICDVWEGANPNNAVKLNQEPRQPIITNKPTVYTTVPADTVDGTFTTTTTEWRLLEGIGKWARWFRTFTTTKTTYQGTVTVSEKDLGNVEPGTYAGGIKVACDTTFKPGVYIIDGGQLDIPAQYAVSGAGVMFVLKNGASVKINGGSKINLTAIQAAELIARGVPEVDANKLAGMLIFEDRNSPGTSNRNSINGNAATVLNGTIYLPRSSIDFTGTATVTSQCLMIAAATIRIAGNTNMSTFCPPGMTEDTVVANEISKVKLVV